MANEIEAIATNNYVLATQQAVTHDNSMSGNGTVDSPLGVVPGYNETVLYTSSFANAGGDVTLSESVNNFEFLEVTYTLEASAANYAPVETRRFNLDVMREIGNTFINCESTFAMTSNNTRYIVLRCASFSMSGNKLNFTTMTQTLNFGERAEMQSSAAKILKVIGINRKAQ